MSPEILNLKISVHFWRMSTAADWYFSGVIHFYDALRLPIVIDSRHAHMYKMCTRSTQSNIDLLSDLAAADIQFFYQFNKKKHKFPYFDATPPLYCCCCYCCCE